MLLPRCALELEKFVLHLELLALQRGDHQVVGLHVLRFRLDHTVQFLVAALERCNVAFSRHKQLLSAVWTRVSSQIFRALSTPFRECPEIWCKTIRDRLTKGISGPQQSGFQCCRWTRNRKRGSG